MITYNVTQESDLVNLMVYNTKGQMVKQLVNGYVPAGKYSVVWDGTDESYKSVSSGVYYSKITIGEKSLMKKMILLK